jgi:DDE family transposase
VLRDALRQLPGHRAGTRPGRRILIRTDSARGTYELLDWLVGQRLSYSVGFTLPDTIADILATVPESAWQIAYDADREPRPGAAVVQATGLLDLSRWPSGMRVIVRRERPHPGAQPRLTNRDGHRLTAFATNTRPGGPGRQLADLELRHRHRARAEDRIRCAKDTGLRNLPLHDLAQNMIWCAVVALADELTTWPQLLSLHRHPARQGEPKRLRLRIFSVAGRLTRSGRRTVLHLPGHAP